MEHHAVRCAVSGANGYVGSVITRTLRQDGRAVAALQRQVQDDVASIPFSLGGVIEPEALHGIDVLIHCAYDFSFVRWDDIAEVNVQGSLQLFDAAKRAGVNKIIFISSMSAFEGCRSLYGQAKLAIEQQAESYGVCIVRPGLVYGDVPSGIVGALNGLLARTRLIPLVGGSQVMYPVHEDDLAHLISKLIDTYDTYIGQPITAAQQPGMTFREIIQTLAERKGKKPFFVPVPWQGVWLLLKSAETLGLRPNFRSDSLISLINQNAAPDFALTEQTGHRFRTFE